MSLRSKWKPDKEEVVVANGAVTAMQPPAGEAGLEMLKKGGNAIDAAVTIGFCSAVVEPYMAGIGGLGHMLIHLAHERKTVAIDFIGRAPRRAHPEMYHVTGPAPVGSPRVFNVANDANNAGPLSVVVPGTCAGLCLAHKLYGVLPLEQVLEPAIQLASEGFDANWHLTLFTANELEFFSRDPYIASMWLPYGRPPGSNYRSSFGELELSKRMGKDKIVQRDLGELLKNIAKKGPDALHRGEVADTIDDFMRRNGGVLTKRDLEDYHPIVSEPVSLSFGGNAFKGYDIAGVGTDSITSLETFAILDNFDLKALGHNSAEYLHLFIEAVRHAFADRFQYLGDPHFVPVPMRGLLSPKYAQDLAQQVDMKKACVELALNRDPWAFCHEHAIHDPWKYDPSSHPRESFGAASAAHEEHTTHFNVVDKDRNMVCCTMTGAFSPGAAPPGTGPCLASFMAFFIPKGGYANSVAGWKRVLMISPLMVFRDGRPILCQGAPGGNRIIHRGVQVITNVLVFGMTPQEAIAQPTVDASTFKNFLDARLPDDIPEKLERLEHRVEVVEEEPGMLGNFSRPSSIHIDYEEGVVRAGVDVFRPVIALGY